MVGLNLATKGVAVDKRTCKLIHVSRSELEGRADMLAKRLGMTRVDAFKLMDAGMLPSTIAVTELKLVRYLMGEDVGLNKRIQ